jgi:hypothetical protein
MRCAAGTRDGGLGGAKGGGIAADGGRVRIRWTGYHRPIDPRLPPFGSARDRPERERLASDTRARLGAARRDKRGGAGSRRHLVKATAPASASSTWRPSCASSAHAQPASTRFHAPYPSRPPFIERTTTGPHLANTACRLEKQAIRMCGQASGPLPERPPSPSPHPLDLRAEAFSSLSASSSRARPLRLLPTLPSLYPRFTLMLGSRKRPCSLGIYLVSTQDGLRMLACCLDIARVYG